MAGSLIERLQLVVDATTGQAEARFAKLGETAGDTAKTARASGETVAAAADRVAQAQHRAQEAAGAVRVAELRLQELRDSGRAKTSQLAAAEEKLAGAQRTLHNAQRTVVAETGRYVDVQARATAETERGAKSAGAMRGALGGLVAGAAAFAGVGLVAKLRDVTRSYVDGAQGAAQLGRSMNATTEEAGRLQGLASSLGLDLDDLVEIQAEFAQKVASSGGELADMGVTISRNADGTTNWALTLQDTLAALQDIPDATKRNQLGFQFFGEEGYKQLSRLVNSGKSVREALEAIGTPFTDEDVRAAREYDNAMLDLSLTGDRVERTLGRALVPLIADLASGFATVVDVVTTIPAPIALTTAAAIALGLTGFSPAAAAGARLSAVMAGMSGQLAILRTEMLTSGAAAGTLGVGLGAAGVLGGGLMSLLGGPLGVGLMTVGTAFYFARDGAEDFAASVERGLPKIAELERSGKPTADAIMEVARSLEVEAGWWERRTAAVQGAAGLAEDVEGSGGLGGFLADIGALEFSMTGGAAATGDSELATLGYADALRQAAEAAGEFAKLEAEAKIATTELANLIAEGKTSGDEYADALRRAAEAQVEQERAASATQAAIDAYRASTDLAVQATLNLIDAQLGQRGSLIDLQREIHGAAGVVDDLATPWNEVEEATLGVIEQARNYAGQVADTAVEAARANGQVVDEMAEAQLRADAVISGLREALNQPGLTDAARAEIEQMIADLETAKAKGDIEAVLRLTGAGEVAGELDATTEDRETTISVESRGGPAVDQYLDQLANTARLATIRVESRNGPAVLEYLRSIVDQPRLALIRVESRNGPAVDAYLDGLASQDRLAIIRVETRGGPAVDQYLDSLANQARNAVIGVSSRQPTGLRDGPRAAGAGLMGAGPTPTVNLANVSLDLHLVGSVSRDTLGRAERGRVAIEDIKAYEKLNGTGWRDEDRRR